ncbi:MAG: PAS domain S-box protein, partial [SAR202 cluster bacterium]|nr:PAS domain S-box protein [SAR202 cluster bacterium]
MSRLLNNDFRLIIGMLIATGGVFLLDLLLPLGVAGGVPYVAPVLIAWWIKQRRWIIAAAALGSVLTIVGFFLSPDGGVPWVVLTNRGLAMFAIWTAAILSYQRKSALRALWISEFRTEEHAVSARIGRVIRSSLGIGRIYQRFAERVNGLVLAMLVLIGGVFLLDLLLPLGVAGGVPYVAPVLIAWWIEKRRWIIVAAALGSVLTIAGFFLSPEGGVPWVVLTNRGLAMFAIWTAAILSYQRRSALRALQLSEIQTEESAVLAQIGRIITSSSDINHVYQSFAAQVNTLIPFDRATIILVDHERSVLTNAYQEGIDVPQWDAGATTSLAGSLTLAVMCAASSVLVHATRRDELAREYPGLLPHFDVGLVSFLAAPLVSRSRVIGMIQMQSTKPSAYGEREVILAERVADQIAGAVANSELYAHAEQVAKEREVLAEIGRIITSSLDISEVYERFALAVGRLLPCDRLEINALSDDLETMATEYVYGVSVPERLQGHVIEVPETFTGALVREQKAVLHLPVTKEDTKKRYPGLMPSVNAGLRSFLGAPLMANGVTIGTIQWQSYQSDRYSPRDLDLAERVASQIAGALDNANIYAENQSNQMALSQSEQRLSGILDIAEEAIVSVDESFRVTMFNQGAAKMFGYEAAEVVGESLDVLIPRESISPHQQHVSEFATSAENALNMSERETEVYGLRKDGTKFPAEKSVSRLEMGDTTVFTAILRDITQRNQAEEALRGSEAQYRELYHGAPIAYISSDAEGIIVQANQRAAELFGYPLDELVGIPLTGLYAATPEGIDKARNIL